MISIFICLLLSGCASVSSITIKERDSEGRIKELEYSLGQNFKLDLKNEIIEADNKKEFKPIEIVIGKV